jgi:hypothetical protein
MLALRVRWHALFFHAISHTPEKHAVHIATYSQFVGCVCGAVFDFMTVYLGGAGSRRNQKRGPNFLLAFPK